MEKTNSTGDKRMVIFGAGKIGRSFIGQVFGGQGYQLVFVDMDRPLVEELNRRHQYPVVIRGADFEERIIVDRVRAIHPSDRDQVAVAIADASIMAVSVGKNALSAIADLVAEGLKARENKYPGRTLDVILAENMRSADLFFCEKLKEALPPSYPLDELVGLVETSIGKMVPMMTAADLEEDPLQVFAEPYNTLILDKKGFRGEIPRIPELALKENMKAWVDRKAFIHNLGHASAAYCGYMKKPDAVYMHEILDEPFVYHFTREVMQEAALVLMSSYPGEFSAAGLSDHIDDLLIRFRNRNLGDTVYRVGSDLKRKLGADDRFLAVIRMAQKTGNGYERIIRAMAMGFSFRAKDEQGRMFPGDEAFHASWKRDPDKLLKEVSGLDPARDARIINDLKQQLSAIL
ncbi:MAG: mannitol-1-phosphate 5-dehydrogenase [Bacteroidota bacterium]